MKSKRVRSPVAPRSERPISDFFKLVGTAVLIVATVMVTGIWSAKHNISRTGMTRILSALIYFFAGTYILYGSRKNWSYISQLRDSVGNQKIKRQRNLLLIAGLLCLLGAAWNLWLFASTK